MILGVTLIASFLIYTLLPSFYINRQESEIRMKFDGQIVHLKQANDLAEELFILNQLFASRSLPFILLDEEENVIANMSQYGGFALQEDEVLMQHNDGSAKMILSMEIFDYTLLELYYDSLHDGKRQIQVNIPIQPLTDAARVIMDIYPIVISVCIIFSLIISFVFSRWVVNPMKKIQIATSRMINLEPNANISMVRKDEIGEVVADINYLYKQLRGTIQTLETEIARYSDSENRKIEFLQTVSHEMKAPLVTASVLTEGMIYKIPPYHENSSEHLKKLKFFLDKSIQLTKESLNLSEKYKEEESIYNLSELIEEISSLYGIIFTSKQLQYFQSIPRNVFIITKANVFQKVLSNLFSNAANHTGKNGTITLTYHEQTLSISNSCVPLGESEVEEIFKPLTIQGVNEHSTGLGLFIVQQLLLQLHIKYSFTTTQSSDGMVFRLYFPNEMIEFNTNST